MPFPLSVKVTPEGKLPVSDRLGVGVPVVVTVKLPALPSVKVVDDSEVIVGAVPASTVRVKDCVASEPTPFDAVIVIG